MADENDTTQPPDTPPVTPEQEPQWATNLRRTIEELPGKLTAVVSDDDKRSIAEQVHGLFEGSGAFERVEDTPTEKPETTPETTQPPETEPKKGKKVSRFASWFAGEE